MTDTTAGRPMRIRLAATGCTPATAHALKQILARHPGPRPVHLLLVTAERTLPVELDPALSVRVSPALRRELHELLVPAAPAG
jgi:hypothetical protein